MKGLQLLEPANRAREKKCEFGDKTLEVKRQKSQVEDNECRERITFVTNPNYERTYDLVGLEMPKAARPTSTKSPPTSISRNRVLRGCEAVFH